jgi:hypothetical protein
MSKALAVALSRRHEAEVEVERILRRDYPPGTPVSWKKNGIHEGVVLDKASGDRIKVKNERTNREFWIYAYCIVDAMESGALTK